MHRGLRGRRDRVDARQPASYSAGAQEHIWQSSPRPSRRRWPLLEARRTARRPQDPGRRPNPRVVSRSMLVRRYAAAPRWSARSRAATLPAGCDHRAQQRHERASRGSPVPDRARCRSPSFHGQHPTIPAPTHRSRQSGHRPGRCGREADQTTARSTSTPRGVAQLKQLASQRDRLPEVHDKRSLPIRSQAQPPHPLSLGVSRLLPDLLGHRSKPYRAHKRGKRDDVRTLRSRVRTSIKWRRGRDSNPRTRSTPVTRFPVAPIQPLWHLSIAAWCAASIERLRHVGLCRRQATNDS